MTRPAGTGIGLVRLVDSDFVPANPEDDLCGTDVYDSQGQRIGSVEDLYIDRDEREVRFLEVGTGGFLGIAERHYLVPVEAVVEVSEDRVTIEPALGKPIALKLPTAGEPGRRRVGSSGPHGRSHPA